MGLFEKVFGNKAPAAASSAAYFKTFTAYQPAFSSYGGSIYEMELTRAAIHAFALSCSKLKPEVVGAARPDLASLLAFAPNPWMDTSKFLYRLATILKAQTTAFIVPLMDPTGRQIGGYYPILPQRTEIVDVRGTQWLRYTFSTGEKGAIELDRVGILTSHQYRDDFFGDGHAALQPTLDLLDTQRQGMVEGIRNSAAIRFMARLGQTLRPEDLEKERERFSAMNLSRDNDTGVMMFDAKYIDVAQIDAKQYVIDHEQMALIQANVFDYFGVNEPILQNSYTEDQWNAFYEGNVEPFALQLGLVMSNMTFTPRERSFGNAVMFSSNRLQYASNKTKVSVVTQLTDRGLMNLDDARAVFNLPPLPDGQGQRYIIRGEYIDVENLSSHTVDQDKAEEPMTPDETPDPEGADDDAGQDS